MKNQIFPCPFISLSKITNGNVVILRMKTRNVINVKHQLKFKQKKETNIGKSILNNVHLIIYSWSGSKFLMTDIDFNDYKTHSGTYAAVLSQCGKSNIYSHHKNISSINFLVILLVNPSFSRNFCQKSMSFFPQC